MPAISFCSLAFREEPVEEIIPRLAAIGYDAVEIWANHLTGKSDSELENIRSIAADAGLELLVISPYLWLTQNEELLAESFAIAEKCISQADILGIRKFRTFTDSGPTGIGSDAATEKQWRVAVESLQKITAMAPQMRFVVETHEKTLADTAESTLELLRRVGAENLKVLYQPEAGTVIENYEKLKPLIEHIHLQNTGINGGPGWLDEGEIDIPAFMRRLKADDYNESLSVEYCWKGATWQRAEQAYRHIAEPLGRE